MGYLFNYRPEGREINTNDGIKKLMVIRKGPRGIVSKIKDESLIILYDNNSSDSHIDDSELDLIEKTIEVYNK